MCETRRGVVTVPNTLGPGKLRQAKAEATRDVVSRLGEDEYLFPDSVRIDGGGTARWSEAHQDYALMDFHYLCTVRVPGCDGWGVPVT